MPFDLSDDSGANEPVSSQVTQTQPAGGRASDMLRPGGAPPGGIKAAGALPMSNSLPFIVCDRPITPADGAIKSITALIVTAIVLGTVYLLFALWSGHAANPTFANDPGGIADQHRILGNLAQVAHIVSIMSWIAVIATVFLYYDIATTGYVMVLIGAIFTFGVPFLTQAVFGIEHVQASKATNLLVTFLSGLGWTPGVPGILLLVLEGARRILFGLQEAKVRRSKFRFGQNVAVHAKRRNVFLGSCWNMPYCREAIRDKCPVHIAKKGPCWRHKRGCMCEESIAVLATSAGDWKSKVAGAVDKIEGRGTPAVAVAGMPPARSSNPLLNFTDPSGRPNLTDAERAQRCRECVIYNTHQEQKYKALVGALFVGAAALVYFANGSLIKIMGAFYMRMNMTMSQYSFGPSTAGGSTTLPISASTAVPISWFIISIALILIVSKMLQLVEYCCFKIKI